MSSAKNSEAKETTSILKEPNANPTRTAAAFSSLAQYTPTRITTFSRFVEANPLSASISSVMNSVNIIPICTHVYVVQSQNARSPLN